MKQVLVFFLVFFFSSSFSQKIDAKIDSCTCYVKSAIVLTGDFGTSFPNNNNNLKNGFASGVSLGYLSKIGELNIGFSYNIFDHVTQNQNDLNILKSFFIGYSRYVFNSSRLGLGTRLSYTTAQDQVETEASYFSHSGVGLDFTLSYRIVGSKAGLGIALFTNYQIFNANNVNYNNVGIGLSLFRGWIFKTGKRYNSK